MSIELNGDPVPTFYSISFAGIGPISFSVQLTAGFGQASEQDTDAMVQDLIDYLQEWPSLDTESGPVTGSKATYQGYTFTPSGEAS